MQENTGRGIRCGARAAQDDGKTIEAVRGWSEYQYRRYVELAEAIFDAIDMRVDGSEIMIADHNAARRAIELALQMLE